MPYRSPSFSSYSGGAMTRQERADAARTNPGFNAWREATKRASRQLQEQKKADVMAGRPYKTRVDPKTGEKRFVVTREELNALTEKYFKQAGFNRSNRQSSADHNKRVHDLSTSQLHRPVSEDEAVDIYLQGHARQAAEGHRTNPTGNRKYPTKGPIADRLKDQSLRGQPIPDRVKHDFKDPRVALRSRLMRAAKRGSPAKSRSVIRACPAEAVGKNGQISRKSAKEYDCEDSWKLRRRSGWKRYQVPGVSLFDSPAAARASALYERAGKQLPTNAKPNHLSTYSTFPRHRRVQSPAQYDKRVDMWYENNPTVKRKGSPRIPANPPMTQRTQMPQRNQSYDDFDALFE